MLLGQSLEDLQCEIVQKSPYKAQVNFCWKHQTELLLYHIQQNRYVDVPLLCAYLSFHHNELGFFQHLSEVVQFLLSTDLNKYNYQH